MRGRERRVGREEKGREGKGEVREERGGRAVEGREGEGKIDLTHPISQIPGYVTDYYYFFVFTFYVDYIVS